ncbi:MAG: hypothetical protein HQ534_02750, partial [Armatimonadetes bacterium]|nr:hypothetical protein [Armatimonadota bacterium]
MKRMKLIFTFIILATSLSFLYAGWDFVAGGYISDVNFVGNNGWAVLSEGLVIHTPDGGTTWEYQQTATTERLYDVSFVDNLEGWVTGNDGLIFHTTDGGNNWIQQNSSTTTNMQSICFTDALNGWAAGSYGEIVHTSDGGATWAPQTSGISSKIYSIYFVDALNGWAVAASDYIIHTTDGGATWVTQTNPTTDSMQDVIFYDANEGWATGLKKIIHTVDGGANWVAQTNPADENLYGIGMGDNNHLWVVGIDGEILTTSDGGTNWIEQSFSLDWFLGAYFEDNLTGWIVGSGGAIYKTTDGGTTWITQQTGTSSGLRRTVFVDDNNVWGCGTKGFIIHSDDGGLTWESKDSGFDDWIWDITFAPDLIHGWAAGDDQTGETPILATVDGGETWIQQLTGIYGDVVGIEAVSNTEVFAAAQDGIILHTTDGGTTWNQQTSGVTVDFKSIEMVSEDIGWAVGASGIIIYTNDGGTTWTQQTSGTTESIYDVSFVDLLNGWAVAYGGVILHTTDGGTTWSLQPSGTTDNFTRVSAIDLNEVWAIAGEGFHTTDGGLTWTAVPIPCSIGLWGVDFANSDVGVAMGNGGIVARYTSGVTLDPPQNLAVTETGYATWDAPLARDLLGYNVYLNGVFVDFTTDLFWQYDETALISGLIYMAGVSALYDEGESSVIEYEFTYVTATLDPPQNLFVDETGYATWEAPGGTGALWEQLANASAEGGISVQDFETAFDIYDAEGADEFIVPTGETWTINEVVVLGHYSAAGPCDLANVRFYEDAAGMPGTLLFEYLDVAANPDVDGNLDCFISDTPFTEGTYWVSVQGRLDFGTCGQWYWEKQAAPTIGYEFHWRNPGDGFGLGFTTWTTGSIPWPPPDYYDYNLSFALYGAVSDGKTTVVKNNINPSYKKSLEKPAKISQTKKPDISLLSRVPSISSSFSGGHSINSRDLLGYNVYLDGAFVDFTTDLFWQYTGLVNGQTYMAGVSAWYDEGESIIVEFEFTYLPGNPGIAVDPAFIEVILDPDEIVVVPLTITNTGTAELTYEITIVEYTSDEFRAKNHKVRNLTEIKPDPAFNESDPDHSSTHGPIIPATDDLFDWQFEWPVGVGGGEAGIETDGNYIYTTKWNGATFFRYAMDGTYIEEFSVTGCPGGIRDLAYDGTYFYGAAASNTVYEMDFDTQTVISTITAPIAVRAIAYDEDADGFWANNWSDAFTLFGRDGATLDSFPCGVFQSCYGLAWENQLDGGPYIWGYFQDGATLNQLVQIDIATGLEPGPNLDIGSIFNVGTGIAGGLCISDAFVPGTWTICGTSQNVIIWGVELCAGDEPWISVVPNIGTIPAGGFEIVDVILNATDLFDITKTADIVIANNAGDDVIVPVTMEVTGPAPFDPPENVEVDIYTGLVTWDPPGGTIYGDDFESYTVGEYLAVQSDDWTTWTNNPGSAEDALISDDYALSGTNSVKVDGTTDLVLIMDNYTSGAYSIALNMYIPTGYCGYYNLQKTNV